MNKAPVQGSVQRQSPREFVRGVWLELRRVTWPTREEWVSATVLTVVLVVAIGLYTWVADWVFAHLFSFIHPPVTS
ncbi:MAG TPA: preprotein translocase subunit SecE [Candidatus Rubrimentiphilum sp.]|nr:preprotein translocase subunit SecE [Candidatus Rubrimentiphilum sp.]